MRHIVLVAALATVLTGSGAPAFAGTATATASISGTVTPSCTVTESDPPAFTYAPITGTTPTFSGQIIATCTSGASYSIGLGPSVNNGLLKNVTYNWGLAYALYSDSGYTAAWGDISGTNEVTGTGTGNPQTYNFYVKVTGDKNAPVGTYTDTLPITISY